MAVDQVRQVNWTSIGVILEYKTVPNRINQNLKDKKRHNISTQSWLLELSI